MAAILLLGALSSTVQTGWAQHWPQWRGPSSNGVSSASGLPDRWSTTENIAWKVGLEGMGVSSPIVWGNLVIVTSQVGSAAVRPGSHPRLARNDQLLAARENPIGGSRRAPGADGQEIFLLVTAYDLSGRKIWSYRLPAKGPYPDSHEKHNLATPTPTTDGQFIYAWFGNGQVVCLDMEGREVWKRHLGVEIAPFLNQWGHGSSPTLYEDLLILLCDHRPNSYLLALDKQTGKEHWRVNRDTGRVSHSTPFLVLGSERSELLVNSSERIDVYDPQSGRLLWFAGSDRQTPIPSPVFHDGIIYLSRGYRNSDVWAIRPGGTGDVTGSHVQWRISSGASYVPSILVYQGLLYMTNEVGVVAAVRTGTGEIVWRERLGGIFFASPAAGDGKVFLTSETGETFVLQAGEEPSLLATNDLQERFLASLAISNGRLFLRSDQSLFCIRESGGIQK